MAAKRFSEFMPIPLGQKMKVVGLFGTENTISEEQVYLLSQEEFAALQEESASSTAAIATLATQVLDAEDAANAATVTANSAADAVILLATEVSDHDAAIQSLTGSVTTVSDAVGEQALAIAALEQEDISINAKFPSRKKTEVTFSGLSLTLTANTDYNLVVLLKALTPTSGGLAPFFNTTSNKLNVYADNASVNFKLSVSGSWSGNPTSNRSLQVDFLGTSGNRLTKSRDEGVTLDVVTLTNFFSVDAAGFLVNNGTAPILRSNGNNFVATGITLIAEQVTTQTSISEK